MAVHSVTDATFESEVLRSEIPVLIDLYADWCAPCKQLAPIVETLSNELAGRLKVVKIDIDHNPMIAQSFRVQSIPMVVVIHEGQVAGHHIGLLDKAQLMALVEPVLPAGPLAANEVKPEELAQLLVAQRAVPVDVREASQYARYRIPTAVNIPAPDLVGRARELLATDGKIRVLYGRSTDEAKELAEKIRETGVEVAFLAGGFLHWEADGLEVERGA